MKSYRCVATEEAFATPAILAETQRLVDSGEVERGFGELAKSMFSSGPGAKQVQARLSDLGAGRLAQMDADGVDLALIAIFAPGVQIFEASKAAGLTSKANDILAEAVRAHPDRYAGLTAVAPQDPDHAAREIERGKALRLKGFLINSHTSGEYLDQAKFLPIFEAASASDMPLYLHPREPGSAMIEPFLDYGLYFAAGGLRWSAGFMQCD
ncbi:MAG TPA: amidohydrolase family protein [Sphingobium sp.]|nr:amidohydrolase family protein [Sphingobium sp.]